MSTLRVTNIKNESSPSGGLEIDSSGHVQIDGQQMPSAGPLGNRNLIINGDFRIWQRGLTASGTGFFADRWRTHGTGASITSIDKIVQIDEPASFPIGVPFTSFARFVTTASAFVSQYVEIDNGSSVDPRFVNNQTLTLSWWSTATHTIADPRLSFVDDNTAANESAVLSKADFELVQTIGSWNKYKVVFTCDATPNGTNRALRVNLAFPAGTTELGAFQLEPGSVPTPFEHRPIGTETALCQRYYQVGSYFQLDGDGPISAPFITEMRAVPTVSVTVNTGVSGSAAGTAYYVSSVMNTRKAFGVWQLPGGGTIGCDWTADAEL